VRKENQPGLAHHASDVEMWTARELEALLKVDVKTIYGYVQRGLIPYVRLQSNVRFPKGLIQEWLKQNSFTPGSRNPQSSSFKTAHSAGARARQRASK
jgi:excisionase family DNA binding protein